MESIGKKRNTIVLFSDINMTLKETYFGGGEIGRSLLLHIPLVCIYMTFVKN